MQQNTSKLRRNALGLNWNEEKGENTPQHIKNTLECIKKMHAEMHPEWRNCGVNRPLNHVIELVSSYSTESLITYCPKRAILKGTFMYTIFKKICETFIIGYIDPLPHTYMRLLGGWALTTRVCLYVALLKKRTQLAACFQLGSWWVMESSRCSWRKGQQLCVMRPKM